MFSNGGDRGMGTSPLSLANPNSGPERLPARMASVGAVDLVPRGHRTENRSAAVGVRHRKFPSFQSSLASARADQPKTPPVISPWRTLQLTGAITLGAPPEDFGWVCVVVVFSPRKLARRPRPYVAAGARNNCKCLLSSPPRPPSP